VYQHSDFSAVTKKHLQQQDSHQSANNRKQQERQNMMCGLLTGESVWTESARDEERICKEKSVRELSEFQYYSCD
jgi:hypothetical protein